MKSSARWWWGACGAAAVLALPSASSAYCRTTTCQGCKRDATTGCTVGGTEVAWPNACVSFSMDEIASVEVDLDTATRLMERAFQAWQSVTCDDSGATPSISVSASFGPAMCSEAQFNQRGGNANIVMFRDDTWPYTAAVNELASTLVSFDKSGEIWDADLEINTTLPIFIFGETSARGIIGSHDLYSIMLHEAGHFLGLDHSRVSNAVMVPSLSAGEVRDTLSDDDIAAICAAYPPDRAAEDCDDTPAGGFSPECGVPKKVRKDGCSVGIVPKNNPAWPLTLVAGLSVVAARRRRRNHMC